MTSNLVDTCLARIANPATDHTDHSFDDRAQLWRWPNTEPPSGVGLVHRRLADGRDQPPRDRRADVGSGLSDQVGSYLP